MTSEDPSTHAATFAACMIDVLEKTTVESTSKESVQDAPYFKAEKNVFFKKEPLSVLL